MKILALSVCDDTAAVNKVPSEGKPPGDIRLRSLGRDVVPAGTGDRVVNSGQLLVEPEPL